MKVVFVDEENKVQGTADLSLERLRNAGVINWVDAFYTFRSFDLENGCVVFGRADLLPLDDEEVTPS